MSQTLRTRPSLVTLLLVPLGVALAAPASAVEVEVTPTVGYRSDGYELQQPLACAAIFESCDLIAEADDDTPFGLVVGFELRPDWQLELLASHAESDLDAHAVLVPLPGNPTPTPVPAERLDLEVTHLQVGLARTWGQGTVRPFVGVAAGGSRIETDAPPVDPIELALRLFTTEDSSEDAFSASAGGGVKVELSPRLGLRLEGRGWWVDLPEDAGGDFTQLDASAGLILKF